MAEALYLAGCIYIGPLNGVILTPDIAKIFHPTPDIRGKICPTSDTQNSGRHPTPNFAV